MDVSFWLSNYTMVISAFLADLFAFPIVQAVLVIPPCHGDYRFLGNLFLVYVYMSHLGDSSVPLPAMLISAFLASLFTLPLVRALLAVHPCHGN